MVRLLQCAWLSLVLAGAAGERTRRRRRQLTTTPAPTSAPTSYFSYGNPSCPCIDTNVTNGTTLTVLVGDDAFEYPGDYGSAVCKAHDMGLGDCVGSGAADDYCSQSWCFIDPALCQSSALRYSFTDIVLDREVYYSYDTCGGSSAFWDDFFETKKNMLSGATLRVAVPELFYPDHYLIDENGDPVEGRAPTTDEVGSLKGVYVEWFKEIAEAGDFELEWTVVSGGSLAEVSSAWDACILDVTKGLLDACPGNFWTTYDRLGRVRFSAPNVIDAFYFMALKNKIKKGGGLVYKIEKPFSPFSFELWLCIAATVVVIAAVRAVVQPKATDDQAPAELADGGPDGDGVEMTEQNPSENKARRDSGLERWRSSSVITREVFGKEVIERGEVYNFMVHGLYMAAMELMGASVTPVEHGKGAGPMRVLTVGFAFFVIVTTSMYTASLAAFMTQERLTIGKEREIRSIDDCMSPGVDCTFCIHQKLEQSMYEIYGETSMKYKVFGGSTSLATAAATAGECDAVAFNENQFMTKYAAALSAVKESEEDLAVRGFCSYEFIGAAIFWFPVAQPVSLTYADSISYWQRVLVEEGEFEKIYDQHVINTAPACDPFATSVTLSDELDEAVTVGPTDFAGIFIGSAFMVSLSLTMWWFERKHLWKELCGKENPSPPAAQPEPMNAQPNTGEQSTEVDVVVEPEQQRRASA